MALVRTKLRRRAIAVAFVLASVIGLGAVNAKPASADTTMCGMTINTIVEQGAFKAWGPGDPNAPFVLHVFHEGRWQELTWIEVLIDAYSGTWYPTWGAYFYIPYTWCAAYVS